jgi:exodeoxyribonuclease-3
MKIICWNVNGIRAASKKGLLEFVKNEDPDLFCVQETKAHREQVEPSVVELFGRKSFWSSAVRKGYSGTASFLKETASSSGEARLGIAVEKFDSEGRFVITSHKIPLNFDVYNIYFPNGASGKERHDFKQEFLKSLTEHLKAELSLGQNIIVLGDYNIAPADIDIYDPIKHAKTSGFLPEEKNWFKSFVELGFVDTFRHFNPNEKNRFSWWNQMERARLGNRGWRIDMICVSKNLVPYLKRADILDHIEGSDHCPILLELKESL